MNTPRNKGFSLVELLVVISIVSVLVALMMPSLGRTREVTRRTSCLSAMHEWSLAHLNYTADNKSDFVLLGAPEQDPAAGPRSYYYYLKSITNDRRNALVGYFTGKFNKSAFTTKPAGLPTPIPAATHLNSLYIQGRIFPSCPSTTTNTAGWGYSQSWGWSCPYYSLMGVNQNETGDVNKRVRDITTPTTIVVTAPNTPVSRGWTSPIRSSDQGTLSLMACAIIVYPRIASLNYFPGTEANHTARGYATGKPGELPAPAGVEGTNVSFVDGSAKWNATKNLLDYNVENYWYKSADRAPFHGYW